MPNVAKRALLLAAAIAHHRVSASAAPSAQAPSSTRIPPPEAAAPSDGSAGADEAAVATATTPPPSVSEAPPYAPHPPAVGLSSLVDRETGRVFWQGGPGSIRLSSRAIARRAGRRHIRATALTGLLALALLSALAARLREGLYRFADGLTAGGERLHRTALAVAAKAAALLLWLPHFERWFVLLVGGLYLLESYCCSTRRYLENALSGPQAVEEYVESLREKKPEVTWKVRCFHYERRRMGLPRKKKASVGGANGQVEEDASGDANDNDSPSASLRTQKVVTHTASKTYKFASWTDKTVAGVWKRAQSSDVVAPFAKISMSKMLVLSDAKAREDYFRQQSAFVSEEGQRDEYAEFSTNIKVEGFKPKVLAIRPVVGTSQPKLFRIQLFWFFTLLGLTVPYRIWFSRHCDELRVTIVKETSTAVSAAVSASEREERTSSVASWLPFWSQRNTNGALAAAQRERWGEEFKRKMQQISLYRRDDVGGVKEGEMAGDEERKLGAMVELQEDLVAIQGDNANVKGDGGSSPVGLPVVPLLCIGKGNGTGSREEEVNALYTRKGLNETNETLVKSALAMGK